MNFKIISKLYERAIPLLRELVPILYREARGVFFQVCVVCLFCVNTGFSKTTFIAADSTLKSSLKTIKPVFQLDGHRSFFLQQWVKMNGLKIGVEYLDKIRLGFGFYGSDYVRLPDITSNSYTFLTKTNFSYSTFFIEYYLLNNYKWEVTALAGLGSGHAEFYLKRTDNLKDSVIKSKNIEVITLAGSSEYKIWPFLGVGLGGGVRLLNAKPGDLAQKNIANAYTAVFYSIGIQVHLNEIYKYYFNREKYDHEKEVYLKTKNKSK